MSVLGYILSALGRRPLRAVEDENDRDGELGETGEAIEKGSERALLVFCLTMRWI